MRKEQNNKTQMFDAVLAYMNRNVSKWSMVAKIAVLVSLLDDFIEAIIGHKDAQNAAKVFIHKNKTQQKMLVAEKADILNDTLEAYAGDTENVELESKAAKSESELFSLRDEDFKTVVTETIKLLDEHLADMADYGMSEARITDLKKNYDRFLVLNGMPRQYRIDSVVATKSLQELIPECNKMLKQRMDKVMKQFKTSDPEFYKGYLAARVVVDN